MVKLNQFDWCSKLACCEGVIGFGLLGEEVINGPLEAQFICLSLWNQAQLKFYMFKKFRSASLLGLSFLDFDKAFCQIFHFMLPKVMDALLFWFVIQVFPQMILERGKSGGNLGIRRCLVGFSCFLFFFPPDNYNGRAWILTLGVSIRNTRRCHTATVSAARLLVACFLLSVHVTVAA